MDAALGRCAASLKQMRDGIGDFIPD